METVAAREATEKQVQRIAVVFTHGQGDQTPMADVMELARSVWTSNNAVGSGQEPIWSVPVYDSDLSEQRRLVTGKVNGLQVDFYQFYWADLMQGNRLLHFWRWFDGQMARVEETPAHLTLVRAWVMRIAAGIAGLGLAFGLVTAARFLVLDLVAWGNFYALLMLIGCMITAVWLTRPQWRTQALVWGGGLIAASLILGLFAKDMLYQQCQLVEALQNHSGPGCGGDTAFGGPLSDGAADTLVMIHGLLAAVTFVAGGGGLWALRGLSKSFLTPVMADSARLFTASPDNIPNRDRIRKRGMELLEALHQSERRYDRIVMVAHSLGTVVAYNVLSQYWGNVYRLFDHSASAAERAAVEAASRGLYGTTAVQPLLTFRATVRAYFKALNSVGSALPEGDVKLRTADFVSPGEILRRQRHGDINKPKKGDSGSYRSPWRVSDFITLGSPLSYGAFLMADSEAAFALQQTMRRLPTNPPDLREHPDPERAGEPHHAALFAATVWTNLHFETSGLVKGDVVGGPVGPKFGPGVMDVLIPPGPSLPRFAHNEYWKAVADSSNPADKVHIEMLIAALNLPGANPAVAAANDAKLASLTKRYGPPEVNPC